MEDFRDDPLEQRLRAALAARAATVEPARDALPHLRSRVDRPGLFERAGVPVRWVLPAAVTGLAAVAAVVMLIGTLSAPISDDGGATVAAPTSSLDPTPAPVGAAPSRAAEGAPGVTTAPEARKGRSRPSPEQRTERLEWAERAQYTLPRASLSPMPAPAGLITVPVYYVRDTGSGPRLYREFASIRPRGVRTAAAIRTLLTRPPLNPSYTTAFPRGVRLAGYRRDGTTAVVELTGPRPGPVALQQLVHTVTATDPGAVAVDVTVNGEQIGTVQRAHEDDILAPVWILSDWGATAPRRFVIEGVVRGDASSVEWEISRGGSVITRGVTPSVTDGLRSVWNVSVELAGAGEHTVRAWPQGNPAAADVVRLVRR